MFLGSQETFHPNVVKHIIEIVSDGKMDKNVFNALVDYSFDSNYSWQENLNRFATSKPFITSYFKTGNNFYNMLMATYKMLYELNDQYEVMDKYIFTYRVKDSIKRYLNGFNTNRSKDYDLDYILCDFRDKISNSSYSAYSFGDNNLIGHIYRTFDYYGMKNHKFIYSVINERGTVLETEEGSISSADFNPIVEEKFSRSIDFPRIVKDIYEASEILFSVKGEVCFDIFSAKIEDELKLKEERISNLFDRSFGLPNVGPLIILPTFNKLSNTDFRTNSIKQGLEMLSLIEKHINSGLYASSLEELYDEVYDIYLSTLNNSNFTDKFPNKVNRYASVNKSTFMSLIKGVKSLNVFMHYIKSKKIDLTEKDYRLFRDKRFYRRFDKLEDYLVLRDITPKLIKEVEDEDMSLNASALTNDNCYDKALSLLKFDDMIKFSDFNLATLNSVVRAQRTYRVDSIVVKSLTTKMEQDLEYSKVVYVLLNNLYETNPEVFNCGADEAFKYIISEDTADFGFDFSSEIMSLKTVMLDLGYFRITELYDRVSRTEYVKPEDDETLFVRFLEMINKDKYPLRTIARYYSFRAVYLDATLALLSQASKTTEDLILPFTGKRNTSFHVSSLNFPFNVSNKADISKLSARESAYKLRYYNEGVNLKEIVIIKDIFHVQNELTTIYEPVYSFAKHKVKIAKRLLDDYDISTAPIDIPKRLKALTPELESRPIIESSSMLAYYDHPKHFGFMFKASSMLLIKGRYYLHERGYLIDKNDYSIIPVNKEGELI